jgi:phosphoribosylglycinamide formyltransferase 1
MNVPSRARVAVLISGRGSNMSALIEAARAPDYPAEIALVIANRPDASGLNFAAEASIQTIMIDHKGFATREAFEAALDEKLRAHHIDMICLAGFMRVLTAWFVTRWEGKLLNIHPSLLPDFKGLHTHQQALDAGVKEHGCTVHYVVPALDAGLTIAQARVPVLAGDDEHSLGQRVLAEEHKLYPEALRLVVEGKAPLPAP